jgi:hypothetical protein
VDVELVGIDVAVDGQVVGEEPAADEPPDQHDRRGPGEPVRQCAAPPTIERVGGAGCGDDEDARDLRQEGESPERAHERDLAPGRRFASARVEQGEERERDEGRRDDLLVEHRARVDVHRKQQGDRGDEEPPPRLRVECTHDLPAAGDRRQAECCANDADPRNQRALAPVADDGSECAGEPIEQGRVGRGPHRGRIGQLPTLEQDGDVFPVRRRVEALAYRVGEGVVQAHADAQHGDDRAGDRPGSEARVRPRHRPRNDASPSLRRSPLR